MRLTAPAEEIGLANAVDPAGPFLYTAGLTENGFLHHTLVDWAPIFGVNTGSDGYLMKQSIAGDLHWQFLIGGSGDDAITGVCLGPAGQVYITGWFSGNNASFKGAAGPDNWMSSSGGRDLFVACYSTGGVLQWRTKFGGPQDEQATGICYANGKLFVTGSYRSPDGPGPSLPGSKALIMALQASDGTELWRLYGANSENSSFHAVAADEERVYAIGDQKGSAYTYSGSQVSTAIPSAPSPNRSTIILALGHDGDFLWSGTVANPGDDNIQANAIAAGKSGLYIGGRTHQGSTFPGNKLVSLTGAMHDFGYVARLDKATGNTLTVAPFADAMNHVQTVSGIALDSHEDLLVTGSYHTSVNYLNQALFSGSATEQIFVVKADRHGEVKWAMTPTGDGPDRSRAIATDGAGKVAITGSYTEQLTFDVLWDDGPQNNLFMAVLSDPDHTVHTFHDPSRFRDPGPLCASDGPLDLNALLIPQKEGVGTPGNVELLAPGDEVIIDLGDALPAGEQAFIHWRGSSTGFTLVSVKGSLVPATGYTDLGTITASTEAYQVTSVVAPTTIRYLRLTHLAGMGCKVESISYAYGSAPDGIWSGSGVSGHLFDPTGLQGDIVIRYDAYIQSTEQVITVSGESKAGHMQGGGLVCPGSDVLLTLDEIAGGSITWHQRIDGQSTWNHDPSNTDTYTLAHVGQPIHVYAEVTNGTCPPAYSDTILVSPQDDEEPAFIHCPDDTIVYVAASACHVQVVYVPPVATDNCGEPVVAIDQPDHQPGQAFPLGTTIIAYTATDASGNMSVCKFRITVVDTISPSITCPPPITTGSNMACAASGIDLGTPVMNDNCGSPLLSNNAPSIFPVGTNTVVWTATDASGNAATCSQVITVIDVMPPTINCPGEVIAFTDSGCEATHVDVGSPGVWDDCGPALSFSDAPGIFPIDTTIVTWTAMDGSGNSASCTQRVVVIDNVPPSIVCPDPVTVSTNTGCTATGVALGAPTTNDNCGVDQVWNNAPTSFGPGNTTVIWTVTDRQGNSTSCNQLVTVIDDVPPTITCPGAVITTANSTCTAPHVDLGQPLIADNCGTPVVTNDAPAAFPLGVSSVTWTAKDAKGNTATCAQQVTVVDNTAPKAFCKDVSVHLPITGEVTITTAQVDNGSIDNCGLASMALTTYTYDATGTYTDTLIVTDNAGNSSFCQATINVVDQDAPTAVCNDVQLYLAPDGHAYTTAADLDGGSFDNGLIVSITAAQTAFTCDDLGASNIMLTVVDDSGNSSFCHALVTVIDTIAPQITCPADTTLTAGAGCSVVNPALGTPFTSDNCSDLNIENNAPQELLPGTTLITWRVTDGGLNTTQCTQEVTVVDLTPPVAKCKSISVALDSDGLAVITAQQVDEVSTDNCGVAGILLTTYVFQALGTYVDTLIVFDAAGNSDTCFATITVVDNEAPTALCNDVSLYLGTGGTATLTAADLDGGSWDNAQTVNLSASQTLFSCGDIGVNTVVLTVTDDSGNSSFCSATVTVIDTIAPSTGGSASLALCPGALPQPLSVLLPGDLDQGGTWTSADGTSFNGTFDPASDPLGSYFYTAPSLTGCGTDTFQVDLALIPSPQAGADGSLTLCSNDGPFDLSTLLSNADPGGIWSNGTGFFDPANDLGPVFYIVHGADGCPPDTATFTASLAQAPQAGISTSLDVCANALPQDLFPALAGAPDPGGSWTDPAGVAFSGIYDPSQHNVGTYTYQVAGAGPCSPASATVTIQEAPPPSAAWTAPGPFCSNSAAVDLAPYVTGDPGGTWQGAGISNGHFFNPQLLSIGGASTNVELVYTVTVAGCSSSSAATLSVDAMPQADAGADALVCGLTQQLAPATTFGTGTWNTGGSASIADPSQSNTVVHAPGPGVHTFTWTVTNGLCTASDQVQLTFHLPEELTTLDAGPDQLQDLNTTMYLKGQADGATEAWWTVVQGSGTLDDPSALETSISELGIGANVIVLSARVGNCPAERDTVILTVRGLIIPTGFSPNGDGLNDLYVVRGLEELPVASLLVFDRWGNQVLHADPYRNDWDGRGDNGEPLMDGTYFGILTIGGQEPWKGNIILKR